MIFSYSVTTQKILYSIKNVQCFQSTVETKVSRLGVGGNASFIYPYNNYSNALGSNLPQHMGTQTNEFQFLKIS